MYIVLMFCLRLHLFLNLRNVSNIFCKWLSEIYFFGFFKPKTWYKWSFCNDKRHYLLMFWSLFLFCCRSHFLSISNHSKLCFRKMHFYATFCQFSALNFEKNFWEKINLIQKEKNVNFSGGLGWVKNKNITFRDNVFQNVFGLC